MYTYIHVCVGPCTGEHSMVITFSSNVLGSLEDILLVQSRGDDAETLVQVDVRVADDQKVKRHRANDASHD